MKNKLEFYYEQGLANEKNGNYAEAEKNYNKALAIDPSDCAGIAIRLASLGFTPPPNSASKAYVSTLFDQYADVFDMILVDKLGYNVPNLLREVIERKFPHRIFDNLLDLGCGTGLVGEAFQEITGTKTGVDLSENMIEVADERDIYQYLYTGDVVQYLQEKKATEKWDLIIAADVLPYMGEIEHFFQLIKKSLQSNGVFAFSDEDLNSMSISDKNGEFRVSENKFIVGPHQRYAHSQEYIGCVLKELKMQIISQQDIIVRLEQGSPVPGQLYIVSF